MSLGSAVGMVINILVIGFLSAVGGAFFQKIINFANTMPTLPQDVFNTLNYLHFGYLIGPVIYIIALWYNHWITSVSESNAEV